MFSTTTPLRALLLLTLCLRVIGSSIGTSVHHERQQQTQQPLERITNTNTNANEQPLNPNPHTIPALLDALDVLETSYFEVWQGIWPKSIDWTSAVIGTYLAATLSTLSTSFASLSSRETGENIINKYFAQLTASYFGQNAFALRQEAYDDMLWVVLGWIEGVKFVKVHSAKHYSTDAGEGERVRGEKEKEWHGNQFIPAFAHRARIFWELASQGWDTSLCGGGMIWSPYLTPYKNAITNELYIAASISMYLYFPGDDNDSPFGLSTPEIYDSALKAAMRKESPAHDPKYLDAAVQAYKWLMESNMTDEKGLFVDGYHVSRWRRDRYLDPPDRKCDERNEMVYTYNQGVLLTGQRGLYEATGSKSYLDDGHRLISDVITATGWDLERDSVLEEDLGDDEIGRWHGIGRSGILEEACDAGAYCSQDSQTFKGIFFHHFTAFCQRLPEHLSAPANECASTSKKSLSARSLEETRQWHTSECAKYRNWIRHNANAALTTKNKEGKFGMWWGAPLLSTNDTDKIPDIIDVVLPPDAVDYRNDGVPGKWKEQSRVDRKVRASGSEEKGGMNAVEGRDLNDRGRGRTVETQGGGVSLLRALWELVDTQV